jgi:hypothetical protein
MTATDDLGELAGMRDGDEAHVARVVAGSIEASVMGPIVARLENKRIIRRVMRGGLQDPRQLPDHYVDELRRVGRRHSCLRRPRLVAAPRIGRRTSSRFPARVTSCCETRVTRGTPRSGAGLARRRPMSGQTLGA